MCYHACEYLRTDAEHSNMGITTQVLLGLFMSLMFHRLQVAAAPLALQSSSSLLSDQGLDSLRYPSRGMDSVMAGRSAALLGSSSRQTSLLGSAASSSDLGARRTWLPSLSQRGPDTSATGPSSQGVRHPRRHGRSGSRDAGTSTGQRTVRMDCQAVPQSRLRHLLGPAFNGRYMSIERPQGLRPPASLGVPMRPRGKGSKKGGFMLGDSPNPDLPSRHSGNSDSESGNKDKKEDTRIKKDKKVHKGDHSKSSLPGVEYEEIVRILDIADNPEGATDAEAIVVPKKESNRFEGLRSSVPLSSEGGELAQGDQPLNTAVVVIGVDHNSGRPQFAVPEHFRQDLPQEVNAVGDIDDIIQDEYSGLLIFLRRLPVKEKRKTTDLGVDRTRELLSRKKRAALSSNSGGAEPWQCQSELIWEDLGADHYPRYIRRVKCIQTKCYNDFYQCQERAFTIKVLRRVGDRCTPVYSATMVEDANGGTGFKRQLLRYEQEWIFEERALSFCCECARRFL